MFNWEDFKAGKIAVHCDTEEKAKQFLAECDKQGIKWIGGVKITDYTYWNVYKKDTAYCGYDENGKLGYANYPFYERKGKTIIKYPFDEFKNEWREKYESTIL